MQKIQRFDSFEITKSVSNLLLQVFTQSVNRKTSDYSKTAQPHERNFERAADDVAVVPRNFSSILNCFLCFLLNSS